MSNVTQIHGDDCQEDEPEGNGFTPIRDSLALVRQTMQCVAITLDRAEDDGEMSEDALAALRVLDHLIPS